MLTIQRLTVREMESRAELGRLWSEVERTRDAYWNDMERNDGSSSESGSLARLAERAFDRAELEYQNAIESNFR